MPTLQHAVLRIVAAADLVAQWPFENDLKDTTNNAYHLRGPRRSKYIAGKVGRNAVQIRGKTDAAKLIKMDPMSSFTICLCSRSGTSSFCLYLSFQENISSMSVFVKNEFGLSPAEALRRLTETLPAKYTIMPKMAFPRNFWPTLPLPPYSRYNIK